MTVLHQTVEEMLMDEEAAMPPVLEEVVEELARQDRRWGVQDHAPLYWLAILVEEVGEVGKAGCEHKRAEYRKELIHVAAVAIQAAESYDRQEGAADGR